MVSESLRSLIEDELRVKKIMTRKELKTIARENGYEESHAERCLRDCKNYTVPCIKLNGKKKKLKPGEKIEFYQWAGGRTIFYATNTTKTKKTTRA